MPSESENNLQQNTTSEQPAEPGASIPQPISEFAAREDFPQCAMGAQVDIGGYVGLVADIVHNSLKVRSPEGHTKSFNFHTLRKLYGPRIEPPAPPSFAPASSRAPEPEPESVAPP